MSAAFRTYVLASVPEWILLGFLARAATRSFEWPSWVAALIVTAWIAKDLLMYPWMRRYYVSEPVNARMVGEEGVALCTLDPVGFVRVHGEIWQADVPAEDAPIEAGARVTVQQVNGLRLVVHPLRVTRPIENR
jgi:membrane-bound ClpP family serine protease